MEALNLLLLAGGLLVFVSLLAGVFSARLGLSYLAVFLVAGMLAGVDGPGGIRFDSPLLAAWVGNAALAIILLEGGVSTHMRTFRVGIRPAAVLASAGVGLTAAMVGAVAMTTMGLGWRQGLLLGAILGSTDAAAVFTTLRQAGLRLDERVSATLEIESGLNDPMAVFLVIGLISSLKHGATGADVATLLARQAGFGAIVGVAGAVGIAWLLRRMPLTEEHGGLLSLVIISGGLALYALAGLIEGSGFLAIYLYGLRLRALAPDASHAASSALDGFAWAAQATMFLLLGLLVTPHEMLTSVGPTLLIAGALIFVARPLSVWLCLAPLRFSLRHRLFIGWVGLRGAVPIVLALFPLLDGVPASTKFFNVTFAVVLASLLLQGSTLGWVARRLRVVEPSEPTPHGDRPVQGRLTLDADLPLDGVLEFFQLPMPDPPAATLGDWMTRMLARDHARGDGVEWHGAHFHVEALREGRIARVGISLARRPD